MDLVTQSSRIEQAASLRISYSHALPRKQCCRYFIGATELINPQVVIKNDLPLDSYHKFMTLLFQIFSPDHDLLLPKRILWRLRKLKNDKTPTRYQQVFKEHTQELFPHSIL